MDSSPLLPRDSTLLLSPLLIEDEFEDEDLEESPSDEIKKVPLVVTDKDPTETEQDDPDDEDYFEDFSSRNNKSKNAKNSKKDKVGGSRFFGRSLSKTSEEQPPPPSYVIPTVVEDGKNGKSPPKSTGPVSNSATTSPNKKSSSPIEIKGSPGKHFSDVERQNNNKRGSSSGDNQHSSSGGRISFFKVLTRRNSTTNQGKHKKLQDQWIQAREPVLDGVTFCVKFLGSTLIENTGAADAAEATKTVIQMQVKGGLKPARMGLTVCTNGITISDPSSNEVRVEISIYDIAHCSLDANHSNIFSFIATNKNDVNECYCFAARKRKMAQHITLTIAQAFNLAYEMWQNSSLENSLDTLEGNNRSVKVIVGSTDSRKSCTSSTNSTGSQSDHENEQINSHSEWVHFDQDDQDQGRKDHLMDNISNRIDLVTLSPFRKNTTATRQRFNPHANEQAEDLLICF